MGIHQYVKVCDLCEEALVHSTPLLAAMCGLILRSDVHTKAPMNYHLLKLDVPLVLTTRRHKLSNTSKFQTT